MSKHVLVPIADGCEELEAVAIIDVLKRAGADVTVASVDGLQITASRGVKLVADRLMKDCAADEYDLIALPGGMPGAEHLRDSNELTDLLKRQRNDGKLYAAICAAPVVALQPHGLLEGKKATCHPGRKDNLNNAEAASQRVVVDGNLITSQGPGTAVEFALELVEQLFGSEKKQEVAGPMVVN
jgi:4-methyl-5(b-hydroxyethyl)-thiazole monophosphate biosynthesis